MYRTLLMGALVGLGGACVKSPGPSACLVREEGCPCSPSPPTCDDGLVCEIGTCVNPDATESSGGDAGGSAGSSTSADTSAESGSGGGSLDCVGDCAPPDLGCAEDEGCYPQANGFVCVGAGDGAPGDTCEFVNDCMAGSACFAGDGGLVCTRLCTEHADCGPSQQCLELATAAGCICG